MKNSIEIKYGGNGSYGGDGNDGSDGSNDIEKACNTLLEMLATYWHMSPWSQQCCLELSQHYHVADVMNGFMAGSLVGWCNAVNTLTVSAAAMAAAMAAETDGKGDAKATESGAANLMAETICDFFEMAASGW